MEEKDGPRAGDIDDLMYMLFGFGGVLRKRQGQLEDRGWQKAQMSAEELAALAAEEKAEADRVRAEKARKRAERKAQRAKEKAAKKAAAKRK